GWKTTPACAAGGELLSVHATESSLMVPSTSVAVPVSVNVAEQVTAVQVCATVAACPGSSVGGALPSVCSRVSSSDPPCPSLTTTLTVYFAATSAVISVAVPASPGTRVPGTFAGSLTS